jgi:hypothetical protein
MGEQLRGDLEVSEATVASQRETLAEAVSKLEAKGWTRDAATMQSLAQMATALRATERGIAEALEESAARDEQLEAAFDRSVRISPLSEPTLPAKRPAGSSPPFGSPSFGSPHSMSVPSPGQGATAAAQMAHKEVSNLRDLAGALVESEQELLRGLNKAYVAMADVSGDLRETAVELGIGGIDTTPITDAVTKYLMYHPFLIAFPHSTPLCLSREHSRSLKRHSDARSQAVRCSWRPWSVGTRRESRMMLRVLPATERLSKADSQVLSRVVCRYWSLNNARQWSTKIRGLQIVRLRCN